MVCHWGMSDKLGMVQYGDDDEYFLGREMMRRKDYSEHTAQEIDAEVKRIIDERYKVAKEIIETHRDKLEMIAQCLLEYETLEGSQVEEIVRTGKFTPPPAPPQVEPPHRCAGGYATAGNTKPSPPTAAWPGFACASRRLIRISRIGGLTTAARHVFHLSSSFLHPTFRRILRSLIIAPSLLAANFGRLAGETLRV